MSLERKLLAAAARSRSAFETIRTSVESVGDIYAPIWAAIVEYYDKDATASAVDEALITHKVAGSGAGDKKQRALETLCNDVWAEDVSPANVADLVRDQALDSAAMRFAAAVAGRKSRDEIENYAREYISLLDTPSAADDEAETLTWANVLRERLDNSRRIKVSPKCLNERLGGGVFPGTNITIFARPETGKSALAMTIACGFARRGLRGLYLTNEDSSRALMVRAASNLTNRTEQELASDPDGGERLAIAKGAGNLIFRDIAPGTPQEVERYIKATKPVWLVIDQLRNLRIKHAGNNTERLDAAAQFVRAMGKKYDLVTIGLTQAGDSASNKLVLEMSDIDGSNTGIPGAGDVIIGIGMNADMSEANQRMLAISKNKLTARHEHWPVSIDPFRSKYKTLN